MYLEAPYQSIRRSNTPLRSKIYKNLEEIITKSEGILRLHYESVQSGASALRRIVIFLIRRRVPLRVSPPAHKKQHVPGLIVSWLPTVGYEKIEERGRKKQEKPGE